MLNSSREEFEIKRTEIIERLNRAGIHLSKGKKKPVNRKYSGIIGFNRNLLKINLPKF